MATERDGMPRGAPLATVLAAATVAALALPLSGVPLAALSVAAGSCCVAVVGATVRRARGRARTSWALVAVAMVLWTVIVVGVPAGWPDDVLWWTLRVPCLFLALGAILSAPGAQRTAREWGVLLIDGGIVGLSALILTWAGVRAAQGSSNLAVIGLAWLPLELLTLSLLAGLAVRTDRAVWAPAALVVVGGATSAAGDAIWAVGGGRSVGAAVELAAMILITGASTSRRLDLWRGRRGGDRPRLGRVSQAVALPALAVAMLSGRDLVTVGSGLGLVAMVCAQLAVLHRRNLVLWDAAADQAARLDDVLADSRDAVLQLDGEGVVRFASDAAREVFGREPAELLGGTLTHLVHPDDLGAATAETFALLAGGAPSVRVRGRVLHPDGSWRHVESTVSRRARGTVPGVIVSSRDATDAVTLAAELRHQARTDALTGLLCRSAFLALVDERLAAGPATVLYCDLDDFKQVNDTAGHAEGDRLLREVARTLRVAVGSRGAVARLGGDEFAVLAAVAGVDSGVRLGEDVARALVATGREQGRSAVASVGVATGHGVSGEALVGDADLAMYEAKALGGGRVLAFAPRMRTRVVERAQTVAALDTALAAGDRLPLHVQPIVDLASRRWVGVEALVRWDSAAGQRLPASFVPLAEETGQIVRLGEQVLRSGLAWLGGCGDADLGLSVNVAGRQLAHPGFAASVRTALDASGVDPARLTLEVTEQTAVDDLVRTGARLQLLRSAGVHVSLDDFGTGFSSLGYLAQLPVDELKIDRRFVAGLGRRPADDALVRAVLRLASDLGLRVVAEGVETAEQARLLLGLGCRFGQGYLFRRPVAATSLRLVAQGGAGLRETGGARLPAAGG